jgi:hypothetical protein
MLVMEGTPKVAFLGKSISLGNVYFLIVFASTSCLTATYVPAHIPCDGICVGLLGLGPLSPLVELIAVALFLLCFCLLQAEKDQKFSGQDILDNKKLILILTLLARIFNRSAHC